MPSGTFEVGIYEPVGVTVPPMGLGTIASTAPVSEKLITSGVQKTLNCLPCWMLAPIIEERVGATGPFAGAPAQH